MTTIYDVPAIKSEELTTSVLGPQDFVRWGDPLRGSTETNPTVMSQRTLSSVRWLSVLKRGLQQQPYCIQVHSAGELVGILPLVFVESALFGRYLVSLSYVNSAGAVSETDDIACQLVDEAVKLADQLNVRYLELRQEQEISHPKLTEKNDAKVLMRLALPSSSEELWDSFKSKLRSQIRAGDKHDFEVYWGREDLLSDFYRVFSHNMRDLGTPVYSQRLFSEILGTFSTESELCVLKYKGAAVAGALLLHTASTTEVPSASTLRKANGTNANMVMYWNLLKRAVDRGQRTFDFGRSTVDSGTYRFKKQWGAEPAPSIWQYYLRQGTIRALRPDNARFSLAIKVWQQLPVSITQWIGPTIVRGIP